MALWWPAAVLLFAVVVLGNILVLWRTVLQLERRIQALEVRTGAHLRHHTESLDRR